MVRLINIIHNPIQYKRIIIGCSIAIKSILFVLLISLQQPSSEGTFYSLKGDALAYIQPIENLLDHGSYDEKGQIFAGRMPGYGTPYLLLRLALSKHQSFIAMMILQLLLDGLAVFCIAWIGLLLFKHVSYFWTTYILYASSTFITVYVYRIIPESFAVSAMIIAAFFYIKALRHERPMKYWWFSGVFLAWAIFLKPVYGLMLVVFCGYLLYENRAQIKTATRYTLILCSTFIIIDSAWVIRNYQHFNEIIPLQSNISAGIPYKKSTLALTSLCKTWGFDIISWNPKAEIRWFDKYSGQSNRNSFLFDNEEVNINLPSAIYTSHYNIDSLKNLRAYILKAHNSNLTKQERSSADHIAFHMAHRFEYNFKSEKPFYAYITAPLLLLKKFIFHSGTFNLTAKPFDQLSFFKKMIKVLSSMHYAFILSFGIIGLSFLMKRANLSLIIAVAGICLLLVFPFIFRLINYRYLIHAYPFLVISAGYTLHQLLYKFGLIK